MASSEEDTSRGGGDGGNTDAYWFDSTLKFGLCWSNLTQHS